MQRFSPVQAVPPTIVSSGARTALLAAMFVVLLFTSISTNPFAASASTLQTHGALSRTDGFGIISHRGAAALAPENTLAALRIAFEQGVDFVEVDLQLTSDGVPVLMHDPLLDRTTSGFGSVADHTLAEIQALDAGSWFGPEYAGEPVPTLEQFLDELAPTTSRALIELKGAWSDEQIEAAVDQLASRYLVDRVAFESFELENLERLGELAPEFARVMLTREWNAQTIDTAAQLGVSAIGARHKLFVQAPELIVEARELGIGTMVYTLNTEKAWKKAQKRGIDLIITDDPVALDEWRGMSEA